VSANDEKFAKILDMIRKLLAKADHANTEPAEGDAFRTKAEELMRKYRIEEEQALAVDPQTIKPELRKFFVGANGEFISPHYGVFNRLAAYCGVQCKSAWAYSDEARSHQLYGMAVGYPSDLRLLDLMYTSARMIFSERLEPSKDNDLSDQVNCYRMRSAGMERNRIANAMWGSSMKDGKAAGLVAKYYREECLARGQDPVVAGRGLNAKVYRDEYAWSFVQALGLRLRRAQEGADSTGGRIQLAGREERVAEAFYALYPDMRPQPAGAARPAPGCAKCAKRTDGTKCRDHRPRAWTKADEAHARRSQTPQARAARVAGRNAAADVQLDGITPAKRVDRYTAEEREDTRQIWAAIEGK